MKMKIKKMLSMIPMVLMLVFTFGNAHAENATKEECEERVKAAVKLAIEQGEEEAFKQINDENGQFVWKDTYVFAITADQAISLAHPFKKGLKGKNLLHVKDANGVLIFAAMAKVASSPEGYGWVEYNWPKTSGAKPTPKISYIARVPGTNTAFGAGIWE